MLLNKDYKFWFCTGSQDLYGEECLAKVAQHSKQIVDELNKTGVLPYEIVWKPTLITNELIRKTFNEANNDETCAGVITWMHTFSPAKSWILGLQEYRKPLMHLHTQFNEELPYDTIDMDFMNENQSAHGDREYGHIVSRMRMERKVVVGHWSDPVVVDKIASWMRTAVGIVESSHIRVMRVADNMRNVAVTEGDKVEAQIKFGWEVDAYPVNEIAESVAAVSQSDTNALVDEYYDKYVTCPDDAQYRLDWIEEYYTPDMNTKYVYPNVFMSREDNEKLSNLQADISKTINAKKSDWIMNGFTDADWDEYIDSLDKYGLEEYLSIFQKYLDSFYETDTNTDAQKGE